MDPGELESLLPCLGVAKKDTLEWLATIARLEDYPGDSILVGERDWGGAAFFIVSGWVKIRHRLDSRNTTLEILGTGELFGEMAILEDSLTALTAIALSPVRVLTIQAQRFLQLLSKDPPLQRKILQITIRRTRKLYRRLQIYHYPPKIKLIKTLLILADYYGIKNEGQIILYNFPVTDLAGLAQISDAEAETIVTTMKEKGWLTIDPEGQNLYLNHLQQLIQISR